MIRRYAAVTLLVIGTLVAPLAAVAVWARNQVLDTNAYVRTVAPLAANAAIKDAVHDRIIDALPVETRPVARQEADSAIDRVLGSEAFREAWAGANRVAHIEFVKLLTGRGHAEVEGGKLVLDLTPVIQRVVDALHEDDPARFEAQTLPAGSLSFALFPADDLKKAQTAVDWLDRLAWLVPVLALLFLGLSVLVARRRRVALVRAGLGLALGMALLLAVIGLARPSYLDAVDNVIQRPAANALLEVIVRNLRYEALFAAIAGVVVAVAAGLAGRRHNSRGAARIAVISGASLAIVLWGIPTQVGVAVIAVLAVVGLIGAQLLPGPSTEP